MSRATSLSVGPLTFTPFGAPRRAGFGIALLYFCGWVMVALLRLCWWTGKALLVAAVLLVAVVLGWVNRDGQRPPDSTIATLTPDTAR
jgi:hypothetical protein